MGGRIALESQPGVGSTFEVSIPLATVEVGEKSFTGPDLSGQSIMLVSPQGIEASLTALRLQRWGAQTCMVADAGVAQALLPERPWHAILIDHALGTPEIEALAGAARVHAAQRIVMFTPATRQEMQPSASSACTGYLVKPLRAASLAARLTAAPDVVAPGIAGDAPVEAPAVSSNTGLSILVAEDNEINALLMRSLQPLLLMVRRRAAPSRTMWPVAILRDAASRLLRMRTVGLQPPQLTSRPHDRRPS
jgi:CheY-like chemotaxis protein